jgi:hypothetical protein
MERTATLSVLLLGGCLFGGPAAPTLEMQNPPAPGPVDVQILDSAIEPGEVYLKLVVHNANANPLIVDRRCLVLTDGRAQWQPVVSSKPFTTVKPNSSAKVKLTYEGVPAGLPTYDLQYRKGAFRLDGEGGKEIALATVRLAVKKTAVANPEPSAATPTGNTAPR